MRFALLLPLLVAAPKAAVEPPDCSPASGVTLLYEVKGELASPRLNRDATAMAVEVIDERGVGLELFDVERRSRPTRLVPETSFGFPHRGPRQAAQFSFAPPDCRYDWTYSVSFGADSWIYVNGWSAGIDEGTNVAAVWSPVDCRFVFVSTRTGRGDLYLWDEGQELQLTFDDAHAELDPAWSPDGGRIAFARSGDRGAIMVLDVAQYSSVQITVADEPLRQPSFSPDGTHLAYFQGERLMWVEATPGARPKELTPHVVPPRHLGAPWTPDGAVIVVHAAPGDRDRLVAVSPRGAVEDLRVGTCGIRDPEIRFREEGPPLLVWVADGTRPGTRALWGAGLPF